MVLFFYPGADFDLRQTNICPREQGFLYLPNVRFFGQSGVKNRFNNGPYAGRTIRDAALEAYVTGYYHPLKFHYVERKVGNSDTVKIAENNRTLTFFCMLGISPVDPICKTGVSSHEKAVIKHSKGMKKCYSDSILVRGM